METDLTDYSTICDVLESILFLAFGSLRQSKFREKDATSSTLHSPHWSNESLCPDQLRYSAEAKPCALCARRQCCSSCHPSGGALLWQSRPASPHDGLLLEVPSTRERWTSREEKRRKDCRGRRRRLLMSIPRSIRIIFPWLQIADGFFRRRLQNMASGWGAP